MTAVAERLDFSAASLAAGAADSPFLKTLRASAAAAANRLEWPDSRASRPWKYYEVTGLGLTPETPAAKLSVAANSVDGAKVTRFSEGAAALSKHISVAVRPETDRLTALHSAFELSGDDTIRPEQPFGEFS